MTGITPPAHAPDVPGLRFRHFRGPADYPGITATGNASREVDGSDWTMSVDDTARMFAHLENCDPATDMIIAEVAGEIVGHSHTVWLREATGRYRYEFDLLLRPEWRGHAIREAMLHWIEARIRHIAATHPDEAPKRYAVSAFDRAESLIRLLEGNGYRPERYFHRMTRPLDTPLPDFPMPPGLELRPVRPEHYRMIWDAAEEAFRDHWGYAPFPESEYQEWQEDPVIFTPELWQIAWDIEKDEVAGQVRTFIDQRENEKFNRRRGYTEFITVRRPYRRRGLARALIAESLRVLKARGMTESTLMVDSESMTGATTLYETCGFAVVGRAASYHKPLEGSTP